MNTGFPMQNNVQNQGMSNNPMMMMMANMMKAQQGMGNMNMGMNQNQMMMQQFQSFLKQNPQFMMEQMKMMGMQANPNADFNSLNTQNTGAQKTKQNLDNQINKTVSLPEVQKVKNQNVKAAKNLNKFREKEKNNNKIIGI